jgi:hypothetical protein
MKPGSRLAVVTHIPLVSSVLQLVPDPWKTAEIYLVTNAQDMLNVLWPYKPRLVLQGHTHIRETVRTTAASSSPLARSAGIGGRGRAMDTRKASRS